MASGQVTGSECLSSYTTCDKHRDEQIEKLCNTHRVLICKLCEITGHKTCDKVTTKDKSKQADRKKNFAVFQHMYEDIEKQIKTLKSQHDTNKKTLLSKLQQCHEKVKDKRKEINAHFDKLDKNLTDSIRRLGQELLAAEENRIKACEHSIREIEKEIKKLKACESTGDNEIMFVGHTKAAPAFKSHQSTLGNLKTECMPRYPTVLFNVEIFALFRDMQEIGQVVEHTELDMGTGFLFSDLSSATFLSDGRLLASSHNPPALFLYGADGKMLFERQADRYNDLAAVSDTMAVGTVSGMRQIHFIHIDVNTIARIKKVKNDRPYHGIGVLNDKLYATCHDKGKVLGDGELVIMTMDATPLLRCSRSSTGECLFIRPEAVCINKADSTVYVVDSLTKKITSISADGQNISQLAVEIPLESHGVCQDGQGTLFVVFPDSIRVVNKERIMSNLGTRTSIFYPQCVDYRESDGALLVCSYGIPPQLFWFK